MNNLIDISSVAHVIQLAVAPVFLLTGIGAILSVLSTRLARVIDRYRVLSALEEMERIAHKAEMRNLFPLALDTLVHHAMHGVRAAGVRRDCRAVHGRGDGP